MLKNSLQELEQEINNPSQSQSPNNQDSPLPNNNHNYSNGSNDNNQPLDNSPNNREREREQIQQEISDLANKPNKTPQEEAELARKKNELERLKKQDSNTEKDTNENKWIKPALIIGSIILVSGLVIYLIKRKSKC